MRVAIRGTILVIALVLAVGSAGTVLCEMDCAAGGHTEAAAAMSDGAGGVATSRCDGEQMDSARRDMPMPNKSSGGNTKHSGGHSHSRIVATTTARIQISPARTFSVSVVNAAASGSPLFVRIDQTLWHDNSPPPIKSASVFAASVLRI